MEQEVLIDWNEAVASLTTDEKLQVKALIDTFLATHTNPENINGHTTAEEDDDLEDDKPQNTPYYALKDSYDREDMMEVIAKFPKNKKWTFTDLQNLDYFPPDLHIKIELLDYKIFVAMDPKLFHQEILSNIHIELGMFVKKNKLGKTYVAPTAIRIDEGTVLKPDILFISVAKYEVIQEDCIEVAPDLVIEVLSPSNYKKLREAKKAKYAEFGIKEYWEIHTKKQKIVIETLDEETHQFVLFSEAQKTGTVQSKILEGFALHLEDVFRIEEDI